MDGDLSVSIRQLPAVRVACIEYRPGPEPASMHDEIGDCFRRVQAWLRERGHDPLARPAIGAITMVDGRLASYGCCIQLPDQVHSGSPGVEIQDLPGGWCAVMSLRKDPAVIGESIGRLYQEYLPHNRIDLDGSRPTYEIYYETTMDYCVPILPPPAGE